MPSIAVILRFVSSIPRHLVQQSLTSADNELFWVALLPEILALAVIRQWRRRSARRTFPGLFDRAALQHRSALLDALMMTFSLGLPSLVAWASITAPVARAVHNHLPAWQLGAHMFTAIPHSNVIVGSVVVLLISDFGVYVSHYLHHRIPSLWAFHSVHHSAPVMTPLTANRFHPVEMVVGSLIETAVSGVVLGAWVALVQPGYSVKLILGTHALYLLFHIGLSAARHSSIPLSFGPVEHIFQSPRLHQLHHSNNPDHFDRNFGSVLTVWDRVFGTLLRAPSDDISFGLDGRTGGSFHEELVLPFVASVRGLRPQAQRIPQSHPTTTGRPTTIGPPVLTDAPPTTGSLTTGSDENATAQPGELPLAATELSATFGASS